MCPKDILEGVLTWYTVKKWAIEEVIFFPSDSGKGKKCFKHIL